MVFDRRSLLNGTLFSGLAALAPAQQSRSSSQDSRDEAAVAKAIDDLNTTIQHTFETSPELAHSPTAAHLPQSEPEISRLHRGRRRCVGGRRRLAHPSSAAAVR